MHFVPYGGGMVSLSRTLAVLTTLVVLTFLARDLLGFAALSSLLLWLMLAGVMGLLIRLAWLPANNHLWSKRQLIDIRAHVVFHLVPFSYLALQLEISPSLSINLLYSLPVAAFFYTGRRTWQTFFTVFGSKIYKLFYRGNTGLVVSLGVLLGLGFLSNEAVIIAAFQHVFMLYFAVHLLIVGAVVVKIESDIAGANVTL